MESLSAIEIANVIEREINRLERIVRDVLDFARPAEPRRVTASAFVLLGEIRDLLRPQLEKSDIELTVDDSTVTKWGAYDYLLKRFEMPELIDLIADAVAHSALSADLIELASKQTPSSEMKLGQEAQEIESSFYDRQNGDSIVSVSHRG